MYTPENAVWTDAFTTGDDAIDFQHKYLLNTFNMLGEVVSNGANREGLRLILGRLRFYADWHFSKEENCMLAHLCPAAGANKDAHRLFINMLDGYLLDIEKEDRLQELAVIIHMDLLGWMKNHILSVDTQLLGCIRNS